MLHACTCPAHAIIFFNSCCCGGLDGGWLPAESASSTLHAVTVSCIDHRSICIIQLAWFCSLWELSSACSVAGEAIVGVEYAKPTLVEVLAVVYLCTCRWELAARGSRLPASDVAMAPSCADRPRQRSRSCTSGAATASTGWAPLQAC